MLKSFFRAIIRGRQNQVNQEVAGYILTEYRQTHPHLTRQLIIDGLNSGRSIQEIVG
jgi:hypothetical protein